MPIARLLSVSAALFAALVIVACGGGGGGGSDDEAQITEVITQSATGNDPADCTKLVTQQFVEQTTFQSGQAAVQSCEQDARDTSDDPDSVDVSEISVDGNNATANVAFTGGSFDGSTLSVALVKDGDQWKLDKVTGIVDFDFEGFQQGLADQLAAAGSVPKQVVDCIVNAVRDAGEEQVKAAFLSGNGEALTGLFGQCVPGG
jgi:hypothetical protein